MCTDVYIFKITEDIYKENDYKINNYKINNSDTNTIINKYKPVLSKKRIKKIERLKNDKDKLCSMFAELLLVYGLKKMGINYIDEEIEILENGKPYLKNHRNIFFNLSHSNKRVMCIISDEDVGCDVEILNDNINLNIARRFFKEQEYSRIINSGNPSDLFYRYWTCKESFIKATGKGMSLPMNEFLISIEEKLSDKEFIVESDSFEECFYMRELFLEEEYHYAVCKKNKCLGDINLNIIKYDDIKNLLIGI